jgi:hypothetical protein
MFDLGNGVNISVILTNLTCSLFGYRLLVKLPHSQVSLTSTPSDRSLSVPQRLVLFSLSLANGEPVWIPTWQFWLVAS